MTKIILALTLLFSSHAFAGRAWFTCKTDADCVMADDPCGAPTAVNKKFTKEQKEQAAKIAPTIVCAEYKGLGKDQLKPVCIKEMCEPKGK